MKVYIHHVNDNPKWYQKAILTYNQAAIFVADPHGGPKQTRGFLEITKKPRPTISSG